MTDTQDTPNTHDAKTTPKASGTQSSTVTQNIAATPNGAVSSGYAASAATPSCATTADPAIQNAAPAPSAPEPSGESAPLDRLISSIRASVAPGVSAETRSAGAAACRALLTALEAQVGEPLMPGVPATLRTPATTLASILTQLASMPREQILEFLRDRFPAAAPSATPVRPPAGPKFHLIQIPQVRPRGSGR